MNVQHIITADDFGFDDAVNEAIAASFAAGLINSTSIMAGAPGFESAIRIAREQNFQHAIGVHLNLTEGSATTPGVARDPAFCNERGRFRFSMARSTLRMARSRLEAVQVEFARQIEICLEAGLVPTHLDSHHHVHNVWPIGAQVIELAQHFHIPAVRIARNMGPGIGPLKRMFKSAYNVRLRRHGVARSDLMGNVSDFIWARAHPALRAELAVHPGLAGGIIIDREEKQPLETLLQRAGLR